MPRPHESFEGVMTGRTKNERHDTDHPYKHRVKARIITGTSNEPGNVNILLPVVDRYVSTNAEGPAGYDWVEAYEIEDVPVSGLLEALHKLGELALQDDGSFKVVD